MNAVQITQSDDAGLVLESLAGDREAFGQIVARYQTLICSLAYSGTGSLSQSEDLAQETFIAAWKQLANLREPHKLRAWLCGILRNLIYDEIKEQGREPSHAAEPLDTLTESAAPEPLPHDLTISHEEAAILWHSLERIPEVYREPLILFYREHQSVEAVAANLELSQDAVKQRLSRGRKLLQEQVLAFVEGALARTNPNNSFTLAVLASLPGLGISAKAATAGATVAQGTAAAKATGALGLLSMAFAPLAVILPNYLAYRVSLAGARTIEERHRVKSIFGKAGLLTLILFIPFAVATLWVSRNQDSFSFLPGLLAAGLVVIYLPAIRLLGSSGKRREQLDKILVREYAGIFPKPVWEYRSQASFFGMPIVHIRIGDRFSLLKEPVKAWIAVGDRAIGGLFGFGGCAMAPLSIGGFSLGVFSIGGLSAGIFALGGIALGVWAVLGLAVGWQAVGCIAIAWNGAAGDIALARNFAVGHLAYAAHANNDVARQIFESHWFCHTALFIGSHWLWLNLLWFLPFLVLWRVACKSKKEIQTKP